MLRPDNSRSSDELDEAAKSLLKGCLQHFRSGVTRVKKISGAVPPSLADAFEARALALLKADDVEQFALRAKVILRDFPKTEAWLRWWMRPSHASMLFVSQRIMEPAIWESIPDTTNAEEAMHWKLYAAAGRNHELLEGMYALYSVALYYQRIYTGSLSTTSLLCITILLIADVPCNRWYTHSLWQGRTMEGYCSADWADEAFSSP